MKYKRVTEYQENTRATIIEPMTIQGIIDCLAELEDKIESGELVDRNEYLDRLMAAKDISGMTDKELEFFAKHNARVREKAQAEVARLTAENAELRARLEKAVDLPVNIGGKIWEIFDNTLIFERNVYHIGLSENRTTFRLTGESGLFYLGEVELTDYKKTWFTAREAAEARLKEIKER